MGIPMDMTQAISYRIIISKIIRFARETSHVRD